MIQIFQQSKIYPIQLSSPDFHIILLTNISMVYPDCPRLILLVLVDFHEEALKKMGLVL